MTTNTSERLMSLGRLFFAVGLIAWGIQHLVAGDFVTRVVPSWPAWMPARTIWAYLVGAALIAAGAAILLHVKARAAALTFGVLAFLSFLLLHLPLAAKELWGGSWTSAGKALVMCGGAMCVAVSLAETERDSPGRLLASASVREGLVIWGRLCLGAFMTLCGIQHFKFVEFVASLVPVWMPGGGVFWTYFAGVALIAGGVGIVVPRVTRLAAVLSGAMIFSWVFLVHVPLALKNPHDPGIMASVFEALAFSGVAFLLAGLASRPASRVRI